MRLPVGLVAFFIDLIQTYEAHGGHFCAQRLSRKSGAPLQIQGWTSCWLHSVRWSEETVLGENLGMRCMDLWGLQILRARLLDR